MPIITAPVKNKVVGVSLRWLSLLASARWTVVFFVLTALAALAVGYEVMDATGLMAVPFVLLVVNLVASLLVHRRFRADLPLLVFHLALLGLVALLVLARLVYLDGRATLTSGTAFNGELQMLEQGPLHPNKVQQLHFINDGFSENFYLGGKGRQKETYNKVRWQDSNGHWQAAKIGDDQPLLLHGYRIYTTYRRGFSPVFSWQANTGERAGESSVGTVQLSAAIDENYMASTSWTLPGGPEVWIMLEQKVATVQQLGSRTELGAAGLDHNLVLRIGEQRHVLAQGQSLDLPEGKLTYLRLATWMGYLINYDPTMPWVMAVIMIGVTSLIWFYWRRIF